MTHHPADFHPALRVLHWLMALMVLVMLFIGVAMVSTTGPLYPELLALHRPVGIAILILVVIRLPLRLVTGTPLLPDDLPPLQKLVAKASHVLLYAAMIGMPLIGWAMLSAGGYPIEVTKRISLPPILPHDLAVYALLRQAHTVVALLFFALILAHLSAALMHGLVRRDGVLRTMTVGHGGRIMPATADIPATTADMDAPTTEVRPADATDPT
ncbi:cytochrome b [Novosphingobium kaempferiae]|uniref:cytochrome b n=1 Tax=Novosphingobium kaempferiae TaxID=2896849 RepID=UPI001E28D7EB|nr:cytochrome b [Novosphingobium kaempferiae]